MRLIQFNSGLRVVLKDVQQEQTEPPARYYLAPPLPPPVHYSSNSSIATTSSSVKSNTSVGTNHEYYSHRQYLPSRSTIYTQCNQIKTPPVINAIPSSTIIIEVGKSENIQSPTKKNNTYTP